MSEINKSVLPRDEFPRQRLQLGIDLGQGRFGKVMMARALNINGSSEWEMVAVKTCKGQNHSYSIHFIIIMISLHLGICVIRFG